MQGVGSWGGGLEKTKNAFARRGLTLSALFNIPMPSNYTPYGYPDESRQATLIADAERSCDRIAEVVKNRADHFDESNTGFFAAHVHPGLLYRLGYAFIPKMDGNFTVDDECTSCGICAKVCPVGNITLREGTPVWNHQCEQCYACLQWCPAQAIQYGNKTKGVPRYHHPDIRLREIQQGAAQPG